MKKTIIILTLILYFFINSDQSFATYDTLSVTNNKFGIHILFPEELSEASSLVNSNGGDWGYVTIPIKASDKDLIKWQTFFDNCKKYHLIPLIRLATDGDYFEKASWSKPSEYDVLDFANFLNNLSWPTKNRYIIIYNEQNRGDEWGGVPDAADYAKILDYAVDIFKEKSQDYFIILGGLDNASVNIPNQSVNQYSYMYQMENAVPGIFSKIDGISSHAYPNPAFSSPPSLARIGINSFFYQKQIADTFSNKSLPVFITETGWSSNTISYDTQSDYYKDAFANYWNDSSIVAVTPFIFLAGDGPFEQFSFIKHNQKTKIYDIYKDFPKVKGEPLFTKENIYLKNLNFSYPTKKFEGNETINSVFNKINSSSKTFFKWLLNV
jgi:hypothetical protein